MSFHKDKLLQEIKIKQIAFTLKNLSYYNIMRHILCLPLECVGMKSSPNLIFQGFLSYMYKLLICMYHYLNDLLNW